METLKGEKRGVSNLAMHTQQPQEANINIYIYGSERHACRANSGVKEE